MHAPPMPARSSVVVARSRPEKGEDLSFLWETPRIVLREYFVAVAENIEDAIAAFDKLDIDVRLCRQLGLQTGGPGQVVSTHAVGNADPHALHLNL